MEPGSWRKEKTMKKISFYLIVTVIVSFIVFIFLYWINHQPDIYKTVSYAKTKPERSDTAMENETVRINDYGDFHFNKTNGEMEKVTDDSIQEEMEKRHDMYPLYKEVTDTIRNEDIVSFKVIRDDTEYFYSRHGKGYRVSEDPDDCPDYLSDLLRGHKANDSFRVKVSTDGHGIIYSDGDTECTIRIMKVMRPVRSEISDEWVKTVSRESDTVSEYKEEIKEYLDLKYNGEDPYIMMEEVKDALIENTEWKEKPEEEIEKAKDTLSKNMLVAKPDEQEESWIRDRAEKEVLFYECVKLIAKAKNISCTEEDIQKTKRLLNICNYYSPEHTEGDIILFNYGNTYSIEQVALIDKVMSLVYCNGVEEKSND